MDIVQLPLEFPKLCECGCGEPAPIADKNHTATGMIKGQPRRFIFGHHMRPRIRPLAERFWSHVHKPDDAADDTACWLWTGNKYLNGYGMVSVEDYPHLAHRVAYELTYGPIADGCLVLHKCDNKPCVNPSHLFLGTQKDNVQDMLRKGRGRYQRRRTKAK